MIDHYTTTNYLYFCFLDFEHDKYKYIQKELSKDDFVPKIIENLEAEVIYFNLDFLFRFTCTLPQVQKEARASIVEIIEKGPDHFSKEDLVKEILSKKTQMRELAKLWPKEKRHKLKFYSTIFMNYLKENS